MSKTIEISNKVLSRLEKHVKGFNDSPSNVIERLLNACEDKTTTAVIGTKDRTKYIFERNEYGKGKLVLAIVKSYVKSHDNLTYDDLLKIFPKELQRYGIGVVNTLEFVQSKYISQNKIPRHYIKPEEQINLKNEMVVVSTEWGAGKNNNISGFLKHVKALGFSITTVIN